MAGIARSLVLGLAILFLPGPTLAHGASASPALVRLNAPADVLPILYLHEHHYVPAYRYNPVPARDAADSQAPQEQAAAPQDVQPRHNRYFDRHSYARAQLGGPALLFFHRD